MRLWSIHPGYLDRAGLVAGWREALLAQAVLLGRTRGYTAHPQLIRFQQSSDPVAAIAAYLSALADEADERGYSFSRARIRGVTAARRERLGLLNIRNGQLHYEWEHLRNKIRVRDPAWLSSLGEPRRLRPHPLFRVTRGSGTASWEVVSAR